jgi:hypothetical protein
MWSEKESQRIDFFFVAAAVAVCEVVLALVVSVARGSEAVKRRRLNAILYLRSEAPVLARQFMPIHSLVREHVRVHV